MSRRSKSTLSPMLHFDAFQSTSRCSSASYSSCLEKYDMVVMTSLRCGTRKVIFGSCSLPNSFTRNVCVFSFILCFVPFSAVILSSSVCHQGVVFAEEECISEYYACCYLNFLIHVPYVILRNYIGIDEIRK